MIIGIGIDIVPLDRIRKAIERYGDRFKNRIFTENEQVYCSGKNTSIESYAARFAVKEAAFKALGKGWDQCGGFRSVEVVADEHSKPHVLLYGKAREFALNANMKNSFVSMTHDADISAAIVVFEK
ncbi:MAG: holo-ACP synthase [Candidatus Latescibacteria bacterium]|nr:holo-ACP synthase [Candidatus Latescibacterota bacterium]